MLWMMANATWSGLTQVVLIHALAQAYEGRSPDLRDTVAAIAGRFATVLGVAFMAGVLIMAGTLAFLLPGIFLMCLFYVAHAVAVLEDTRAWPALWRSASLIQDAAFKVLGAVVTVMALTNLLRIAVARLYRAPDPLASMATPLAFAADVFLALLTAAVATSFYFALRIAKEGYDLELMADTLNPEDAPAPA